MIIQNYKKKMVEKILLKYKEMNKFKIKEKSCLFILKKMI